MDAQQEYSFYTAVVETSLLPIEDPFQPYHSEDEPVVACFSCHGMLVGRPGQRLCHCGKPEPLPPALAEKARVLQEVRDATAATYRKRIFPLVLALLDGADESEGRELWRALWPVARDHIERRMEERGLLRDLQ